MRVDQEERANISTSEMAMDDPTNHKSEEIARKEPIQSAETLDILGTKNGSSETLLQLEGLVRTSAIANSLIEEVDKGERANISKTEMTVDDPTIPTQPLSSALNHESEEIVRKEPIQSAETLDISGAETCSPESPLHLEGSIIIIAAAITNSLVVEVEKEGRANISTSEMAVHDPTIPTQPLSSAFNHESEEIARKEPLQPAEYIIITIHNKNH